jgi:hypothetical protein
MTIERLRHLYQARPFQPFDMHLADGRSLPVDHPELLGFSTSGRTVAVGLPEGVIEIVDLLLVTSLKQRPPAPPRRGRQRGPSVR